MHVWPFLLPKVLPQLLLNVCLGVSFRNTSRNKATHPYRGKQLTYWKISNFKNWHGNRLIYNIGNSANIKITNAAWAKRGCFNNKNNRSPQKQTKRRLAQPKIKITGAHNKDRSGRIPKAAYAAFLLPPIHKTNELIATAASFNPIVDIALATEENKKYRQETINEDFTLCYVSWSLLPIGYTLRNVS